MFTHSECRKVQSIKFVEVVQNVKSSKKRKKVLFGQKKIFEQRELWCMQICYKMNTLLICSVWNLTLRRVHRHKRWVPKSILPQWETGWKDLHKISFWLRLRPENSHALAKLFISSFVHIPWIYLSEKWTITLALS